ncbi:hypothetical protein T8K17_04555 [Thalassobaculum sp. OXR-137]|uniref:hypothetical protein n=1 Tax=Thalassobaculum sp. OXR-137 TaxID=3100173 RepID=UPI002AC8E4CB|nr:hypothetical protein [Thalassobaculum sp. OXR-137]WPZ35418.1 hypothetical protein T8K17_04555 [Thalassobaculum sp. OXR-137]
MSALNTLAAHLDRRGETGRPLLLWWRDDDLETPSAELSVCLDALHAAGIAAAFAAIPSGLTPAAVAALDGTGAALFVHGWAHTDHAPAGEKKSEYGPARPVAERLEEIARGREAVEAIGGDRAFACFVPPWNRIGDDLLPELGAAGILALSAFAPPRRAAPAAAVPRLDTHVDLIDWRGTGKPVSGDGFVARLFEHDGVDGPVGILSHHRVTDRRAWTDWAPLLRLLSDHPAVRWLSPGDALARVGVEPGKRRCL